MQHIRSASISAVCLIKSCTVMLLTSLPLPLPLRSLATAVNHPPVSTMHDASRRRTLSWLDWTKTSIGPMIAPAIVIVMAFIIEPIFCVQ